MEVVSPSPRGAGLALVALVACGGDPQPPVRPPGLAPAALLSRASLDLRGVRPSLAELRAAEADPASIDDRLLGYLDDPRVGWRTALLFDDAWRTRANDFDINGANYAVRDEARFLVAMGEEPLRVLARVVDEDLPYTELLVGDWTMADPYLAEWFSVDYPAGATGWQLSRYTDSRPNAGVLSTSGLWWRNTSTFANANRGRANALSRMFLCRDYLAVPIETDAEIDLLDEDSIADALRESEGCAACHHSLDPLGAYLWGFYDEQAWNPLDLGQYNPERERRWEEAGTSGPAYYGQPGAGLADLGHQLAADPRMVECAVQQTFEVLAGRPATVEDTQELLAHREAFLAAKLSLKSLMAEVLVADPYQGRGPRGVSHKVADPDLVASAIADLTGFRFVSDGHTVIQHDAFGLRTLGGAGSVTYGQADAAEATPMSVLIVGRLAEAAAWHAVAHDLAHPDAPRLLTRVDPQVRPSDADLTAQLQDLHLRVLARSVEASSDEIADSALLWRDVFDLTGSPQQAWSAVVAGLLRDPDFLLY